MKKICILLSLLLVFTLVSCDLIGNLINGPDDDPVEELGEARFDLDIAYPMSAGYAITSVHITMTHQVSGVVVEDDLTVDVVNETASGTFNDLRVGLWDIDVELFESDTSVGTGTGTVDVEVDVVKLVTIVMDLDTGGVEVVVTWGAIPRDGLVAEYLFSGDATDSSGNGNDGTANGGTTYSLDRFGDESSAALFDGVDDSVSTIPFTNTVFSFSYWINTSFTTDPQFIFSNQENGDTTGGIGMGLWTNGVYFTSGGGAPAVNSSGTVTLVYDGVWHHVVGTYDSDTIVKIYIDGTEYVNETMLPHPYFDTIMIGTRGTVTDVGSYHFLGSIDDFRIYSRDLSDVEIQALYIEGGWTGN